MIRERPPISDDSIARGVEQQYGLVVARVTFLPIGYDPNTAVYRLESPAGDSYFLKLTRAAIVPASLRVPRALIEHGVTNVLASLPTRDGDLWCALDAYSMILYPFIDGENAMRRGLTERQWIAFGATLAAIHGSGLESRFAGEVPVEDFATPMIARVRAMQREVRDSRFELPVQRELAAFWQARAALIRHLTDRAEQIGNALRRDSFELALCHGDVHAANIMIDRNGAIFIVDWDTPRIAPRERDLLFVVGSMIARRVTPEEESWFFAGYGARAIDWRALAYYRYERALEDIYECGRSVFFNDSASVAVKEGDARLLMGLFEPGDIVQAAMDADSGAGQ